MIEIQNTKAVNWAIWAKVAFLAFNNVGRPTFLPF